MQSVIAVLEEGTTYKSLSVLISACMDLLNDLVSVCVQPWVFRFLGDD